MKTARAEQVLVDNLAEQLGFSTSETRTDVAKAAERFTFSVLEPDNLQPAPIRPEWILDGSPEARCSTLSIGTRRWASTNHWSCTKGKFHWHFRWDETVLFVEGEVTITDEAGNIYHGRPGVSLFFPAGTSAVWEVPSYIRKIAFNQKPVPYYLNLADRIVTKLGHLLGFSERQTGSGLSST